jgi:hypothetical protein
MLLYRILAHCVAVTHLVIIFLNLLAVPLLIINMPFYIWMPIITLLVNPMIGGAYCMFNRLENYFRFKAFMPPIQDRIGDLLLQIKRITTKR